jgi:outer membrane receptor protein involved in Fe transport
MSDWAARGPGPQEICLVRAASPSPGRAERTRSRIASTTLSQAATVWNYKDYGATVTADWTGRWFNDGYTVAGWGENAYTLIGASLRYRGFYNSTITLAASNLFNNQPPPNGRASSAGYDQNIYGPGALGRFLSIRIRKEF